MRPWPSCAARLRLHKVDWVVESHSHGHAQTGSLPTRTQVNNGSSVVIEAQEVATTVHHHPSPTTITITRSTPSLLETSPWPGTSAATARDTYACLCSGHFVVNSTRNAQLRSHNTHDPVVVNLRLPPDFSNHHRSSLPVQSGGHWEFVRIAHLSSLAAHRGLPSEPESKGSDTEVSRRECTLDCSAGDPHYTETRNISSR